MVCCAVGRRGLSPSKHQQQSHGALVAEAAWVGPGKHLGLRGGGRGRDQLNYSLVFRA